LAGSRVHHMARFLLAIGCLGLGGSPVLLASSTTFAPEFDLYLTHNKIFGSRLLAVGNYQDTAAQWTSAYFEYTMDIGLKSFFRRYVYKDPNTEKSKYILTRFGYSYFPDFTEASSDEHRALSELTFRLPMGGKWLWTQSNKGEVRFISSTTAGRYRNRLKLERGALLRGVRATPYAAAEGFYDMRFDKFVRVSFTVGIEFPWKHSVIFEPSFTHAAAYQGPPAETIGFTIQKHMAMPFGGTQ
jgi:hypothetical protein